MGAALQMPYFIDETGQTVIVSDPAKTGLVTGRAYGMGVTLAEFEKNVGRNLTWYERMGVWWQAVSEPNPDKRIVTDYSGPISNAASYALVPVQAVAAAIEDTAPGRAIADIGNAMSDTAEEVTGAAVATAKLTRQLWWAIAIIIAGVWGWHRWKG